MTAREKLDYRNRAEEDEKLDYRDEITEGKEEHRTEHPNSSYQAANQHMVKFKDELKAINEKTATEFDFRKNPAEYDLSERKEALEAVEQALNKTQWNNKGERWVAAGDIAQNSFQPMYRRIELAEAAAQYRFPNEFLAAMKEEQINYAEENQTEDGTKVLEFHLKDIETAQRLVEHSNRAFQMVSTWQLDHCRDQFAFALYESDKNPNAAEQMGKILERGIDYYNGEIYRDADLDGKTEEDNTFQQKGNRIERAAQELREKAEAGDPAAIESLTNNIFQLADKGNRETRWLSEMYMEHYMEREAQVSFLAREDTESKAYEQAREKAEAGDPEAIEWMTAMKQMLERMDTDKLAENVEESKIFQQDDEAASGKQQMAEEKVEYEESSYAEMMTFRRLEDTDEETLDHEVSELVHQKLQHTETYLEELQKAGHQDAEAVAEVQRTLYEVVHGGIQSSVENGDEENFIKMLRHIEEANRELALKMWERKGFVEEGPDHPKPALPDEFKDAIAIDKYHIQFEMFIGEHLKGTISPMNLMLLSQMNDRMDLREDTLADVQDEWDKVGYRPGDEGPPGMIAPRDLTEEFQVMHNIAAGMEYLMRVEDPIYWKLNHMDDEERKERLDETLQEHLDDARLATGDERGENVEFLLETLQASFSQHLEQATHGETDLREQQGKDEATAFRTSHRAILDEMENITDYAKTIRDGTSDITTNVEYPNPINEFRFDPNNQMYDNEQQKKNYIEAGTTFSLTYENMLGNGENNLEGNEENMKLLQHVTDRCVEAMREISDNPDSFDDRIQEAIQCSRIMTGMVTVKEREENPE